MRTDNEPGAFGRRRFGLLLLAGALVLLLWSAARSWFPGRSALPLRRAAWYWRHPFALSTTEKEALRRARITRLYVHTGTAIRHEDGLRLVSRQVWIGSAPCEVDAVFRIHPDANSRLLAPGGEADVLRFIQEARLPAPVRGLQLDADVPTALLPEYARFLAHLRRSLPPGWRLGVTALPDWLRSPAYQSVCDAVDEVAPQFYGNRWPEAGKPPPVLWETEDLPARIERATTGRARAWIGLPAYGRCFVTDARLRPAGVRHDLDPDPLLEDPTWEFRKAETRRAAWNGEREIPCEDQVAFQAREETIDGPLDAPAGTWLWFQWPRADGLRRFVSILEARRSDPILGVCFFRWPEPDEPLAYPLARLLDDETERTPQLRLTPGGGDVKIEVENLDTALPGPGFRLEVMPGTGELAAEGPVSWLRDDHPVSATRGEVALLSRPFVMPGGAWNAGVVRGAKGKVRVRLQWQAGDGTPKVLESER